MPPFPGGDQNSWASSDSVSDRAGPPSGFLPEPQLPYLWLTEWTVKWVLVGGCEETVTSRELNAGEHTGARWRR